MADKTGIEWTDATWNPVTGCTKVSAGCKHCYAEREWPRLTKLVPAYAGRDFTDVRTHTDRLDQPLRWKKPRRVFVNSMSDLFHESVPFEFIDQVFAVMALAPQHTFQILTKRAGRMREYILRRTDEIRSDDWFSGPLARACFSVSKSAGDPLPGNAPLVLAGRWPLPNVHLGVSIEDQPSADERIIDLRATPAAVRWISAEPLLGPVDLTPAYLPCPNYQDAVMDQETGAYECCRECDHTGIGDEMGVDWVVVGGESGPKARPMSPDWARNMRDQCAAAGVPFLFKQWGEWTPGENVERKTGLVHTATWFGEKWAYGTESIAREDGHIDDEPDLYRVGKRAAGRLLDGVQHDGYPEVL